MPISIEQRLLFDVELQPVSGDRFQPTGFPDIGHALFKRPIRVDGELSWVESLLVESPQSMANRLEEVGWDATKQEPVQELEGLPYVRVVAEDDGRYLTSSRVEAHRLASAFVKDARLGDRDMREVLKERLGLRDDTPLDPLGIARAVFELDPLCLIHGVFFADHAKVLIGSPKIARALTGFIEAEEVKEAISGGVKRDVVRHSKSEKIASEADSKRGYGFIPYHRTEYTAGKIVASFSLDRGQIRSYGLGQDAEELLEALALWEIRSVLHRGLRLRTACDLAPVDERLVDQSGTEVPTLAELTKRIGKARKAVGDALGAGEALTVKWGGGKKKKE